MEKILEDRWKTHNPQDRTRIMWDLALVEAYLKPELTEVIETRTPPENTERTIRVYTRIDEVKMTEDFWEVLRGARNR